MKTLKIKPRATMQTIIVVSAIAVFAALVLIDRMVNGTLYSFGLHLSPQWAFPYQIYFDLGIALLVVNAVSASLLGLTNRFERGKEPEKSSTLGKGKELVSTPQISPAAKSTEEKTEIKSSSEKGLIEKTLPVLRYCRYCSFENEPDAVFCEKCGKNMVAKNRDFALTRRLFCRACGVKNKVSAVYCKSCGQLLN